MNFKDLRGFALTEILVVGVVILVLAGLVITGVRGFQASDRDAKRIADLAQIQADLKLYSTRWGHYPGDKDGAIDAPANWAAFTDAFTSLGIKIPNDPTDTYYYAYSEDKLAYVLGAKLERSNKVLGSDGEVDGKMPAGALGSTPEGIDCRDNNFGYCISL